MEPPPIVQAGPEAIIYFTGLEDFSRHSGEGIGLQGTRSGLNRAASSKQYMERSLCIRRNSDYSE